MISHDPKVVDARIAKTNRPKSHDSTDIERMHLKLMPFGTEFHEASGQLQKRQNCLQRVAHPTVSKVPQVSPAPQHKHGVWEWPSGRRSSTSASQKGLFYVALLRDPGRRSASMPKAAVRPKPKAARPKAVRQKTKAGRPEAKAKPKAAVRPKAKAKAAAEGDRPWQAPPIQGRRTSARDVAPTLRRWTPASTWGRSAYYERELEMCGSPKH